MRKLWGAIKAAACLCCVLACAGFALALHSSPAFEAGESYEFYLGASSSAQRVVSQNPALDKLFLMQTAGESVRYTGDRREEILTKYRARVLFSEEAGGVVNYYCYSPLLSGGVRLNGYAINLHVAVSSAQTAAGTPLIFGGF